MAFLELNFHSEILGKATQVWVIMPQKSTQGQIGMDSGNRAEKYKCLYLLHGCSDDYTIWMRRTSIERYAARYGIAVVMPDAERSYYCNQKYGYRFYDYLTKELPALIEDMFPVSSKAEDRYVAGLSMGGYGALKMALREEGRYAMAAALSPVGDIHPWVREYPQMNFITSFGENTEIPDEDDILYLLEKCTKKPKLFMAIGTEDVLYRNNFPVRAKIAELGYDFTYMEGPGSHNWDFWDVYIQRALEWMFENKG